MATHPDSWLHPQVLAQARSRRNDHAGDTSPWAAHARREQVRAFILSRPHGYSADEVGAIVDRYFSEAAAVGLDPLLATAQMILETGYLTSPYAQPGISNFAGIGVTGDPAD